ncbi:MAG: hypothetical protein NTY22_00005, partial [Proteobacteria bacterium]|nr:hypothetical protein [Pseudomonadota bacterium]
ASAVVIEIEPRGRTDDDAIILHELLHAKYSLEQDFRKFIDKYIDAELKKKNSEASRILKDINENLLNTYPEINTNAYLRNNEIFVRLLIPIPKTAKECQDTTLLENKIRDAMALYEKINAQKFILPYLWYNIHSVWSYKDTNKKFFKSKFIDYVCNRTIKFEL